MSGVLQLESSTTAPIFSTGGSTNLKNKDIKRQGGIGKKMTKN